MNNVIVYLLGPPGVGKYTVGRLAAERLPAELLDNHDWILDLNTSGLSAADTADRIERELMSRLDP